MWEFMKSTPWTFVAVGAVLLLAIAGVVYGILTQDSGFINRDGKRLYWEKSDLPLVVSYTKDVPIEYLEDARNAIVRINRLVNDSNEPNKSIIGPTLHKWDIDTVGDMINEIAPNRLHILFDMLPEGSKPGGHADLRWDERTGKMMACHIRMLPGLIGTQRITAINHEFGHALCLAHDRKRSSIMHPIATNRSKEWTSGDLKRLRKEYM